MENDSKRFLKIWILMNLETLKDEIWRKLESFNKTKKEEDGVTALENERMVSASEDFSWKRTVSVHSCSPGMSKIAAWGEASSWRHVVPPRGAGCYSLFLLESTLNGCVVSSLQRVGIFGEWREVFHGFQPMYVHGCACGEFSPNSAPSCFSKYGAC